MTRDRSFLWLLSCFLLSGLAGLIYETVWTQQFALVFGTSELAVAAVLGAYMAGLALGAALAQRLVDRLRRPVLLYAVLELAIAVAALAVPAALGLAGRLQVLVLGGLAVPPEAGSLASALFYLGAAFAVLVVPTALMGATLPLLARFAVRRDLEVGPRVGMLYTANTVGAALGTLMAAFVLLPRLGLGGTVWFAVAVNATVFVVAALLARTRQVARDTVPTEVDAGPEVQGPTWILPAILISGFVSLSWEVLWTRLLSHLLGGTIYAFGTMLATFLAGIALGSAVASRLAVDATKARRGFAFAQLGVAVSSFVAFAAVDRLPGVAEGLLGGGASLVRSGSLAALTLLPGALFVGATFPFAVRILAGGPAQAGVASARVYAWNTVGAILGSVITGFVLLPELLIAGTATLAVAASLLLALATALFSRPRSTWAATGAALGLLVLTLASPKTPWRVLRTAPLSGESAVGEVAYYGVGRSATVLLVNENGYWRLSTNGLPEAAIQPPGSRVGTFTAARWMGLLPTLSRPEAKSMMIVGLGAALTLGSVPPSIEEIHVVELEPEVIEANRRMGAERLPDPLADPRLQFHIHDARSALMLSDRHFDAIVSQPSHPWTSGSSHLFTREFFDLVHAHLGARGVFVQWMGLRYVDADLLRTLIATLADVFAYVEVYQPYPGGSLLFLCGDEPVTDLNSIRRGLAGSGQAWRQMGVLTPADILVERLLTFEASRRFSAGAPLNTDFRNLLKMRSPKILRTPIGAQGVQTLLADFDSLTGSGVIGSGAIHRDVDGIYTVRRLLRTRQPARAGRVAESLKDAEQRNVALALASGRSDLSERILVQALGDGFHETAASAEAFSALLLRHRLEIAERRIPTALRERIDRDPAATAVTEGWRRLKLGDVKAVRTLEPVLASIGPQHPLFDAATHLRIVWRESVGEPAPAREALDLLEPMLAFGAASPDLLRRARLAVIAGEREVALASLIEMVEGLDETPRSRAMRREGLRVLLDFPLDWNGARSARLANQLAS